MTPVLIFIGLITGVYLITVSLMLHFSLKTNAVICDTCGTKHDKNYLHSCDYAGWDNDLLVAAIRRASHHQGDENVKT